MQSNKHGCRNISGSLHDRTSVSPRKYRKYLIKFQSLCHIKRGNSNTFFEICAVPVKQWQPFLCVKALCFPRIMCGMDRGMFTEYFMQVIGRCFHFVMARGFVLSVLLSGAWSMNADMRNKRFITNVHKENNFNILKTAAIYGSNNTGKTCFVKCIACLLYTSSGQWRKYTLCNRNCCRYSIIYRWACAKSK